MKLGRLSIKVPEKVGNLMGISNLKLKNASPEIFLGLGIAFMGGAIVTAIRAARRHDQIIADHEGQLEEAKCEYIIPDDSEIALNNDGDDCYASSVFGHKTDKQIAHDVRKVYAHTIWEFTKLYSPTITLSALSVACFVCSHNIQARRFSALSGAYTGLREAFEQYQARNIELNGKTNHEMCKYGWKEIDETYEDPDTGETITEKKKVPAYTGMSEEEIKKLQKMPFHDHLITFDRNCALWKGIANLDEMTLYSAEADLQRLVRVRGWAIINDLYDYLNMERTEEGMFEGWVKGFGPQVSLHIDDPINHEALRGVRNQVWILDPNVHGNVFSLLHEKEKNKEAFEQKLNNLRLLEEEGKA